MARKQAAAPTLALFEIQADLQEPEGTHAPVPRAAPKLKWSYSKRGVLEQCPRKFYYQYYGANRSKAKDDPAKQELRQLKLAGNRYTRTGEILHVVIADYLRKAQQDRPWERQHWLDWARKVFERDIARSREGLNAVVPSSRQHPAQFLVEFLHEPDAGQLCREALTQMMAALASFLDAPAFMAVRELGMQEGAFMYKPLPSPPDSPAGMYRFGP